jgi:hypothetical protein
VKNLSIFLLISIFSSIQIQAEEVELDSPEGWGMAYMSAASLNLSDSHIEPLEFGEIVISAELSTIPELNSEQQKIGFGGIKYEDLNKSPVFGRGKIKMGFYWDSIFEISLTPSVEIKGAKPKDLYGFSLSKELYKNDNLNLGFRVFSLSGYAIADVTCSAEVVNQPLYTPGNPSGCIETSKDRIDLGHHGLELIVKPHIKNQKIKPWFSFSSTKIDPSVRIDAQLELTREIAFVETKGTLRTFTAGVNYSITDKWALNLGTSYTPLDVIRPSPAGGDDNLWNFRIGISFNTE